MVTEITCSMLDSPSISDDDYMNTGDSKSTSLEPTIKHLTKVTRLFRRAAKQFCREGTQYKS